MPVEREAIVFKSEPDVLWLRLQGRCSQCTGCAGRCDLTRLIRVEDSASGELVEVPRQLVSGPLRPEQTVTLVLDERALRHEAWWAYGMPCLGLVVGAIMALVLLGRAHTWLNEAVFASAAVGTLLAMQVSKRHCGRAMRRGLRVRIGAE
ncbi:SoxR reducing system RseC family protein [Pseudomarimonas arenosa]|uniref:SoxR reducing system RseC family protein n=1 Tax=Pseudomarimonas arenosa TaxID=2774145 RepID=A0AAW3ZIJ0_9GAMM|nr:SoxR reducing system RseC family protein [Pseudomarimonas arenosa]